MVLAMSTSVASELGSIDSCACTMIPLEIHSLLRASDSPSASRVDSSIGSAVVDGCTCAFLLLVDYLWFFVATAGLTGAAVTSTAVSKRP
jgi:hypothetical protein